VVPKSFVLNQGLIFDDFSSENFEKKVKIQTLIQDERFWNHLRKLFEIDSLGNDGDSKSWLDSNYRCRQMG
jgi:hypothetical protein